MNKKDSSQKAAKAQKLSAAERTKVDRLVNRVAKEYGKTLRMLGRE